MPLPSDEKMIQLASDVIAQFHTIFGLHPGFRPAHAKGILLTGTFAPAAEARSLTRAPHILRESTPVTARFSNSTGIPILPDNDPNANPRGLAIRFHLGEHKHTDIIGHSTDGFPVRTGQEFLEFLRAVASSAPGTPSPSPVEKFLGSHPAALAFVQAPKPHPGSFAKEAYFAVTAFRFIDQAGQARYGRYRVLPTEGVGHLDEAAVMNKDANYLFAEITERISAQPVRFRIEVQVAEPADTVDDATIHWPADRRVIPFGTLTLTAVAPDNAGAQQQIIFDPIPRVDGIEGSADPLLEFRAAVYLLSGRERRQAPEAQVRPSGAA
jgi:catalase